MFIKCYNGYVNTRNIRNFYIIRNGQDGTYRSYIKEYVIQVDFDGENNNKIITSYDTEEEAEKYLKKLIEKINAE